MNKPLLLSLLTATALNMSCSTVEKVSEAAISPVKNWSLVHKQTIQQGNVLTSKDLEKIELGMSQEEVRLALGSPSLVDIFHQQRWDYLYWLKIPGKEPVQKDLSLYFVDGTLDRMTGEYEPDTQTDQTEKRVVVDVPDYKGKGIFNRALESVGIGD